MTDRPTFNLTGSRGTVVLGELDEAHHKGYAYLNEAETEYVERRREPFAQTLMPGGHLRLAAIANVARVTGLQRDEAEALVDSFIYDEQV